MIKVKESEEDTRVKVFSESNFLHCQIFLLLSQSVTAPQPWSCRRAWSLGLPSETAWASSNEYPPSCRLRSASWGSACLRSTCHSGRIPNTLSSRVACRARGSLCDSAAAPQAPLCEAVHDLEIRSSRLHQRRSFASFPLLLSVAGPYRWDLPPAPQCSTYWQQSRPWVSESQHPFQRRLTDSWWRLYLPQCSFLQGHARWSHAFFLPPFVSCTIPPIFPFGGLPSSRSSSSTSPSTRIQPGTSDHESNCCCACTTIHILQSFLFWTAVSPHTTFLGRGRCHRRRHLRFPPNCLRAPFYHCCRWCSALHPQRRSTVLDYSPAPDPAPLATLAEAHQLLVPVLELD